MTAAIIIDIVLVCILILTMWKNAKKGFMSGIVSLVGNLVSLFGAMFVANKVAPIMFEKFFKTGLLSKIAQTIQEQGVPMIESFVNEISAFLPTEFVSRVVENAKAVIDFQAPDVALQIVDNAVAPLMVPVISVVLFFLIYALLRFIVIQLSAVLVHVNKVPLIGGVNKILGLVTGAACGVIEVLVILCAIWAFLALTNGGIAMFNEQAISQSLFYKTFNMFNPFLKL